MMKDKYGFIHLVIYTLKKRRDLIFSLYGFKSLLTLSFFKIHQYKVLTIDSPEIIYLAKKGMSISRVGLIRLINRLPTAFKCDDVYLVVDNLHLYYWTAKLLSEPETLKFIKKYFKRNHGIFVDVGACIGGYSIRVAKYARRVYAIEPEPKNFYFLQLNKKINKINNLIIINAAAYYTKTKIPLYVSNISGHHSIALRRSKNTLLVDSVTLDEILAKEEFIDIIKIDVEGAEHFVLEGAKETLKKTKYIVMEVSSSFKKANKILEENNFELIKFFDGSSWVNNALFVNKNMKK